MTFKQSESAQDFVRKDLTRHPGVDAMCVATMILAVVLSG